VSLGQEGPGLYVHLPFCSAICPYCDFYVLTGDTRRRHRYIRHLLAEIALCGESPWPSFVDPTPDGSFDTLYFGGGTPSLLRPRDLQAVRAAIDTYLPLVREPWIGLEANPEDITEESLAAWEEIGVRFLSLGIQSFDDKALRLLGRQHEPPDCRRSAALARQSDIETLSLDLIFGLPGQSAKDWQTELEIAASLQPDHLSCYQLTVEPGTPFGFRRAQGRLSEMARDEQADLFLLTHTWLAERGFTAYEVSNFSTTPRHRSRHNRKYWSHTPYLGLGPSAHSFASRWRWWNRRKIKPYESQIDAGERPIQDQELLTPGQLRLEHLMLGLRTPAGVDFHTFPDGSGPRLWVANRSLIDELAGAALATVEEQKLIPTLAGLAVAEALACRFELLDP